MPVPSPVPAPTTTRAATQATAVARLSTDAATAQRIGDALAERYDGQEVAASAFEEPDGRWSLAIHFRDRPDEAALRALIMSTAGAATAQALTFETLAATDWVRKSLEGLTPVDAGRFVVHGAHDRARVRANRIGIEIEAALAFGTGHHGTTRGCLLALDRIVKGRRPKRSAPSPALQPKSDVSDFGRSIKRPNLGKPRFGRKRGRESAILDIGTGTGVLAIAAARALRRPVLASDIDARAVMIARENARLNRAGAAVQVVHRAGVGAYRFHQRAPFDLIFANILLEPLRGLATPLARLVAPRGHVVLSGLLLAQATPALASYRARGLVLSRRIRLEGWATLVLVRPARSRWLGR
jgi:ribosomal protein L11 methyltransferase